MSRKEYLISLLEELKESWELAPGLLILVRDNEDENEIIEGLLSIIESATATTKDIFTREKLEKAAKKLKEIQKQETVDYTEDQKTAELLLSAI